MVLLGWQVTGCSGVSGSTRATGWNEPGSSASDFDRNAGPNSDLYDDGFIGSTPLLDQQRAERAAPGPYSNLVAGPIQPRHATTADDVRAVQRALARRGYYQGEATGAWDDQVSGALSRFQADQKLPITGQVDGATARALDVPLLAPPTPRD